MKVSQMNQYLKTKLTFIFICQTELFADCAISAFSELFKDSVQQMSERSNCKLANALTQVLAPLLACAFTKKNQERFKTSLHPLIYCSPQDAATKCCGWMVQTTEMCELSQASKRKTEAPEAMTPVDRLACRWQPSRCVLRWPSLYSHLLHISFLS